MAGLQVSEILLGILLLVYGKRMFWLYAGIIGFISGMALAPRLLPGYSELIIFALALTLGLVGSAMAVVFQWVAIIAAGFLGGGYLFFSFFPADSYTAFFIGGIIGALLMAIVFDWALIILSSLVGAVLISQSLTVSDSTRIFLFTALAAAGIVIQSAIFLSSPKK